ncbi:hypothetical protein MPTK1_3g19630 [Marchantia polymorpha subsp. ruderalis]|uniref:Uncharacterized protein n=2 Tax=Marchantia polymorpha TaxID=3197 RepID=A0AAF6B2M1_MARPO|nr:hypothetical protein MARPO_0049s0071 [Marchantia polymorpha]BBN06255.1 hypothetical protein Mp_3g19630 [Marchantia polymorpha subsp. ruderalis]|eukprot:PTQ38788.1 hypothetical protein MARPO_0049s0071 [Marchantia polymorpha]
MNDWLCFESLFTLVSANTLRCTVSVNGVLHHLHFKQPRGPVQSNSESPYVRSTGLAVVPENRNLREKKNAKVAFGGMEHLLLDDSSESRIQSNPECRIGVEFDVRR